MCKVQCFLALIALSIGAVHSWDVALSVGDKIELYKNQTIQSNVENEQLRDVTALAYDTVHNMLLFVDNKNDNASIFTYSLSTKKYQSLVRKRSMENIQGLAFDPMTNMLFWTDSNEKSILWMSLKQGSKNGAYGNLLFKMDNEIPRAIAVDSCRGYVYWTNTNVTKPTIERARFDGSERQVIVHTDIYMPVSLVIDQKAKRLYWADDKEGIHYSIETSDLEGKNRFTLLAGINHQPNTLTISKDTIYWVDWGYKTVWQLPKNIPDSEPVKFKKFLDDVPFGIVANYDIEDQIAGIPECENLRSIAQNRSTVNEPFSGVPPEMGLFCLHGNVVKGKSECKCALGYTGERCDTSVCQNYCFKGDCSVDSDGNPTCRCDNGYTGQRCETNVCHGYCLNNGVCTLDEKNAPVCSCLSDHEGSRCETWKVFTTTLGHDVASAASVAESRKCENISESCNVNVCFNYCLNNGTCKINESNDPECSCLPGHEGQRCEKLTIHAAEGELGSTDQSCNCTQNGTKSAMLSSEELTPESADFVTTCAEGWDSIRDPIIMVLGVGCGLLCLACALLITKILQLKKRRPRIKKRIIINKNVTPMTARPDQCEITIENCCNMNICETPCFEPRSTIRPTLLDSKPGKEEKKNLIANMEYPDDC